MTLRKLSILLAFSLLLFSLIPALAQDSDTCDLDSVANQVEAAHDTYARDVRGDTTIEASLDSLDALYDALDNIYTACDETRYQAYLEEGTTLLEELRAGGYIIYVRHTETDRTQSDTDFSSCDTQRNLNEQGRMDAVAIGEAWAITDVPVSLLISTQLCRTRETAELAFGEPDMIVNRGDFEATDLAIMLTTIPEAGTNTIIVGHIGSIQRVTGIRIPQDSLFNEGDALIYRPTGDDYELVGRIGLRNWFDLARIAGE